MDQDRGRDFRRKKYSSVREKEEKPMKRPIILMKSKDTDKTSSSKTEETPIPTILLKSKDGESRAVSPHSTSSKSNKESDSGPAYQLVPRVPAPDLTNVLNGPIPMKCCVKLLNDENQIIQDGLLEYLTDSTDFLVIGCVGMEGVGKSTLLSYFAKSKHDQFDPENMIFNKQSKSQIDSTTHATDGIDAYITEERVILLDTQPILSLSVLTKHYSCEGNLSARSCSRDDPDYPCMESDIDLLALQYVAFLLSVCHVVLLVQDHTVDLAVVRFLEIAEMLKPFTSVHSDEDTILEYFPHIVFVHNKMSLNAFTRENLRLMQEAYKHLTNSQIPFQSGIGIANGNILKTLTPELCNCEPINIFLLPNNLLVHEEINYESLVNDLRVQIFGLAALPLTHTVLTEKNWWHYTAKIWEDVKKSKLFPEFGRQLPTPSSVKAEINQT